MAYADFVADGTGWRNATYRDCLPSAGAVGLVDVTEEAGYGWRFFRDTARTATRRALLPAVRRRLPRPRRRGSQPLPGAARTST